MYTVYCLLAVVQFICVYYLFLYYHYITVGNLEIIAVKQNIFFLNTHMGWMHTQQLREVLANHLNKIISKMEDSIYSPVLL